MAEFTLELLHQAIGEAVCTALPGVTVYDNPSQQGTRLPALFITCRGTQRIEDQIGGRWLRKLRYDLCYLERHNRPDLGERYIRAAEALDGALESVSYPDGLPLRLEKRGWFVELDSMHYQFDLNIRVRLPYTPNFMESMNLKEGLS